MNAPTFLDLFCGCGGFSLGMERAGFACLAAIDFNPQAVATLRANFPHLGEQRARQEDLTEFAPEQLANIIGVTSIDVIVGGPPCQGFSAARKVDGSNHGDRLKEDRRRHLYREFLRYVAFFRPRVFVMENVLGLRSAAGGRYFTAVQHEARQLGYRVYDRIEDAYALGVPQKRRRQLIIGERGDLSGYFPRDLQPASRAQRNTPLGPAISDLPPIPPGGGLEEREYDHDWRRGALKQFGAAARNYLYKVLEVGRSAKLTAHRARPHNARDLRDFALLREGESSAQAMRRGVVFEWPYSKEHFKDRYTRQSRHTACSTIVAHLSKDGLMFIHPWQNRSFTPREAARVQSFPDWFRFPVARTHQFRVIGNAVPPLVSEAIGDAVQAFLRGTSGSTPRLRQLPLPLSLPTNTGHLEAQKYTRPASEIPRDLEEAQERLRLLARFTRAQLRALDSTTFRRCWNALLYIFPDLHPDSALDHGDDRFETESPAPETGDWRERYQRSGRPVALVLIGEEAWRRHHAGELSDEALYCVPAQHAGLKARREASEMK